MHGTTTDDESIAMRLELETQVQQAWGSAHMKGLVKDKELGKQTVAYESTLAELLARPTSDTYKLPPIAAQNWFCLYLCIIIGCRRWQGI